MLTQRDCCCVICLSHYDLDYEICSKIQAAMMTVAALERHVVVEDVDYYAASRNFIKLLGYNSVAAFTRDVDKLMPRITALLGPHGHTIYKMLKAWRNDEYELSS